MTHSIFIKSHSRDFPWLEYCLESIRRFSSGFDEVVLCLPEGENFEAPGVKVVHVRETFTGYLFQQAVKLYADQLCSGDFITFQDSDTIFTEAFTPNSFKINEKPYWIIRPYDSARPDQHVWRKPTSDFLGREVDFEGMYRHPFTVHRSVLQRMRGFCQFQHGTSLDEYIHSKEVPGSQTALTFSEWNAVGAFAWFHCKDQFHWIDASKEEPPKAIVHQGHTWSGEQRKLEDIAKFKEILVAGCGTQANPAAPVGVSGHVSPVLTEQAAIEFLASQVRDNFHKARIVKQLQAAWKGKGTPPRKKSTEPLNTHKIQLLGDQSKRSETLLLIHSYPGANETVERHWPHYLKSGSDRIVGVGTDDGKCEFPELHSGDVILLGKNAYMSTDREDDHLCRRLLDTVKYCLTQPEDRFIIAEYDVLFLKKFPSFKGVCAFKTGDRINGSHAPAFYHGPWCFDRESGSKLIDAMEKALPLSNRYPNNSPDIFFGLAVDMQGIEVSCPWKMFTRNSLDTPGDLELAVDAALDGVHVIHGVKQDFELQTITEALNGKHLSLSHVA